MSKKQVTPGSMHYHIESGRKAQVLNTDFKVLNDSHWENGVMFITLDNQKTWVRTQESFLAAFDPEPLQS